MKQRSVFIWMALLSLAVIVLSAFAEEAELTLPQTAAVIKDPNATPAPTIDPAKYAVKVTRMGRMLNIQYTAADYEDQSALSRGAAPTLEIYKGDLLLESGSFEFG